MAKAQRIFYTVDPLDVWVRVNVLAEKYGEPSTTMHDVIKALSLPLRWRGHVAYTNERAYQDAIAACPSEKPNGKPKEQRGGNGGADVDGQMAVPGGDGRRPRLKPKLRVEEGGA